MTKKENLIKCLRDYDKLTPSDISVIEVHNRNGEKYGIGNPDAKRVILECIKTELRRQIDLEP